MNPGPGSSLGPSPEPQASCLARDTLTLPPRWWRVVPKPCGTSTLKICSWGQAWCHPGGHSEVTHRPPRSGLPIGPTPLGSCSGPAGEGHQEITQLRAHWVSCNLSCVSSPRSCSNPHVPQDVICPNCEEGASMPQACAQPPAVLSPCSRLCPPLPIIRISRHVSCLCSGLPSSERGSKDTDQSEQRGGAVWGGEGGRPPDDHPPPPHPGSSLPGMRLDVCFLEVLMAQRHEELGRPPNNRLHVHGRPASATECPG